MGGGECSIYFAILTGHELNPSKTYIFSYIGAALEESLTLVISTIKI